MSIYTKPRIFMAVPMIGQIHPSAYMAHLQLSKPPGTAIACTVRAMPDEARNGLAETALKHGYEYIFFIDDDMVPFHNELITLYNIMEDDTSIDVLSSFTYRRKPPYWPCVMKRRPDGHYDYIETRDVGLIDVDMTSIACTIIRTPILHRISKPWFAFETRDGVRYSEDVVFCEKVKAAGGRIVVNSDREVLHISESLLVGRELYEKFKRDEAIKRALQVARPTN